MDLTSIPIPSPQLAGFLTILSLVMFFGGILLTPWFVSRLPDHFFHHNQPQARLWKVLLRNLLGYPVLLTGIAMLVLPGQGILTIIIGLGLIDFPYKRRMINKIAQRPGVMRLLNSWRKRFGKGPFLEPG